MEKEMSEVTLYIKDDLCVVRLNSEDMGKDSGDFVFRNAVVFYDPETNHVEVKGNRVYLYDASLKHEYVYNGDLKKTISGINWDYWDKNTLQTRPCKREGFIFTRNGHEIVGMLERIEKPYEEFSGHFSKIIIKGLNK